MSEIEWVRLGDVARQTARSRDVVLRLAREHGIPAQKNGRFWFVDAAILEWLAKYDGAKTKTSWQKVGRRIRKGESAFGKRHYSGQNYQGYFDVFTEDQTEPIRKKPVPKEIDVCAALWVANRHAKRARDASQRAYFSRLHGFAANWKERKQEIYGMKSQAMHWLIAEGELRHIGYHRFEGGWAELYEGNGYTFHRPCPKPANAENVPMISEIDAKPRGSKEPRLCDALFTLQRYLSGREHVDTYQWDARYAA